MDLLRIATAGSVDDGKSTLVGRLLHDCHAVFEDQLDEVRRASLRTGADHLNLALLTDGLRAEREQGITIDVAYRYFATPRRKFILADTPGHVQYTRNMVTGASTAGLALILVDARRGVLEQTRRHAFLASLLRVPHMAVCVNKMDLVGYEEAVFDRIVAEFTEFARRLDAPDVVFLPLCALHGDNVAARSVAMPWYEGPTLLYHLEHVHVASDANLIDARFPVQYVLRPLREAFHDYRGLAGTVAAGRFRPGDEVLLLPSGFRTTVASIEGPGGPVDQAGPGEAVTIRLADDLDAGRGDMICRPRNQPHVGQDIEAMVCWFAERSQLTEGARLAIKHTTRWARVAVEEIAYRLDVNTLGRDEEAKSLSLNEIGRVRLRVTQPLFYDSYRRSRTTGSFVLVDEHTNLTVGAGMMLGPAT